MNKYEIETAILTEFAQFMPTIEHLPFDTIGARPLVLNCKRKMNKIRLKSRMLSN